MTSSPGLAVCSHAEITALTTKGYHGHHLAHRVLHMKCTGTAKKPLRKGDQLQARIEAGLAPRESAKLG
jgi:hypothetical protein